jgi:hypothetical protein
VFQQLQTTPPPLAGTQTLVWLADIAPATSQVALEWTLDGTGWELDYNFYWCPTAPLSPITPGSVFALSSIAANMSTANSVNFSASTGTYAFSPPVAGPAVGNLYINQDATIVAGQAAVGIGMCNYPVFAVPAAPSTNLIFTPTFNYFVTFGTFVTGQVLDAAQIAAGQAFAFEPGITTVYATLAADGTWTISNTEGSNS